MFAYAAAPDSLYYSVWGAVIINVLFVFTSGPWMDQRQLKRRPEHFPAYMARTNMLLPWPPSKGKTE